MTQEAIDAIKKECQKNNPYSLFTGLSFAAACLTLLPPGSASPIVTAGLFANSFMLKKSDEYRYERCVNEGLAELNCK